MVIADGFVAKGNRLDNFEAIRSWNQETIRRLVTAVVNSVRYDPQQRNGERCIMVAATCFCRLLWRLLLAAEIDMLSKSLYFYPVAV